MAEYAATYGGLPAPSTPWPLFLALLKRVARFESRARLRMMDAVRDGIGAAFDDSGASEGVRSDLFAASYPVTEAWCPVALIPNLAQEGA